MTTHPYFDSPSLCIISMKGRVLWNLIMLKERQFNTLLKKILYLSFAALVTNPISTHKGMKSSS